VTNNVVVICGGSRCIGKNVSTKGYHCVTQFVKNRRNTNVMIMSALHRFDILTSSRIHEEVGVSVESRMTKMFNPLKTKRRPLYLKTQSVWRSKHFSSRL
jgi:hypothetical protein